MAKPLYSQRYHPIIFLAEKVHITRTSLYTILHIDANTFAKYLKEPGLIPLRHILTMAGLFGISPEELVYIILRNKPSVNDKGKWYIEEIRNKYK